MSNNIDDINARNNDNETACDVVIQKGKTGLIFPLNSSSFANKHKNVNCPNQYASLDLVKK